MNADLNDLLGRIRIATCPDRELDAAITIAIGEGPDEGWELITHVPGVFMMDAGRWIKGNRIRTPKPFTASVDAALALVERKLPGWGYDLSMINGKSRAGLWRPRTLGPAFHGFSDGSMPLAIVAALLSALSSGDAS